MKTEGKIQPFNDSHYADFVDLINQIYPQHPTSIIGEKHADRTREKKMYI